MIKQECCAFACYDNKKHEMAMIWLETQRATNVCISGDSMIML